jgi:VanZ family protein
MVVDRGRRDGHRTMCRPREADPTRSYPATMRLRRLWPWIPVIAWAAVIFAFSSVSGLGTGLGTWDLFLRKVAHAGEFALLAFLLWRALRIEWAVLLLATAYAASDEFHQTFVEGRVGAVTDWAIDTAGVVMALVGLRLWRTHRNARNSSEAGPTPANSALDDLPGEAP